MPTTDLADFALRLRQCRSRSGLTQEELAERAGISIASVSLLERGLIRSPQKGTLHLLARALDLSAEERDDFIASARPTRAGRAAETSRPAAEPSAERYVPTPLTAIIGRERDEAAIVHLLSRESIRLLTVTGPAGVGKTRLALQVAHTLSVRDEITPCFVPLVTVRNPAKMLAALACALGVRKHGLQPLRDVVISALRAQRLLLVLDNFEQIASAGTMIADLLCAAPQVTALVTSREWLNVRGEQVYPLAPLETPDTGALPDMGTLTSYPAVALFLERARAVQPLFALQSEVEGRMLADICARLDGLPLAIELAAARVRRLTLRAIHEQLMGQEPLSVLTGGAIDLAEHQHSMWSAIDWSYTLLTPDERHLFRVLSMFSGGTLDDAAAYGASAAQTREGLFSLADKSLIHWEDGPHARRYFMLEMVRAYGVERLREAGELGEAQRLRAEY